MRSNPERLAIRTKLLEVYAKRRDIKGFELLATQLFALTRGEGEEWAKAQELGAQIDPENSLYRAGGAPERHARRRVRRAARREHAAAIGGAGAFAIRLVDRRFDRCATASSTASTSISTTRTSASPSRPARARRDRVDPAARRPAATVPVDDAEDAADVERAGPPAPTVATSRWPSTCPASRSTSTSRPRRRSRPRPAASTCRSSKTTPARIRSSRKIELAEEFQRIGDKDGARDLLREVLDHRQRRDQDQGAGDARRRSAERRWAAARAPQPATASAAREGRARRRLPRLGLSAAGRASPAARPCRTSVDAALSAFADRPVRCICAGRTDAGVHALNQVVHFDTARRARRRPGCAAPTVSCPPTSRCSGAASCRRVPFARQRDRPALRLRAARVAGAAGARSRAGRLDLPPARRRADARGRASAARRARLQRFPLVRVPGAVAGEDAALARHRAARRLLAFRFRRRRLPAPHDPQHDGLPDRGRQRHARAGLAGRRAGVARPRAGRRDLRARRAATSSARTTMPAMRFPNDTPAMAWLP